VLPVVDGRLMYVVAILVGTVVTAVTVNLVKMLGRKRQAPATDGESSPAAEPALAAR
jgi:fructose-specific PTS system IIC-like component